MSRVLTFGELMLRLTTPGFQRFGQAQELAVTYGGAEANVAAALAGLGAEAEFLTRLPANELADRALAELRGLGVSVARIARGGARMGVYFLEQGIGQRAGKVIYDRAHSAFAEARAGDFPWDGLFAEGVDWFHWSGITPALSPDLPGIVAEGCAAARQRGLPVSFDLNYRAKLWSPVQAGAVLAPLMEHVDLCVTRAEEARTVFGIVGESEAEIARDLAARFGLRTVALTMRQASAAETTEWGAMLFTNGEAHFSRRYQTAIVDRLGAGDSFTGTLIFALRRGDAPTAALELAVAASCLKHTVWGDYSSISLAEAEALAAGGHGGRVRR